MSTKQEKKFDLALWFGAIVGCYAAMPQEEKESLENWEAKNLGDGITSTSDWPGWEKYIGRFRPSTFDVPSRTEKKHISVADKMETFSRDGFRCKKCGSLDHLTIDHIIPESKGGAHEVSNFQTLCRSCNSKKGTRQ